MEQGNKPIPKVGLGMTRNASTPAFLGQEVIDILRACAYHKHIRQARSQPTDAYRGTRGDDVDGEVDGETH